MTSPFCSATYMAWTCAHAHAHTCTHTQAALTVDNEMADATADAAAAADTFAAVKVLCRSLCEDTASLSRHLTL